MRSWSRAWVNRMSLCDKSLLSMTRLTCGGQVVAARGTTGRARRARNDGGCIFAFSRRIASEVCLQLFALDRKEGAGNAGCTLHPRSHVQWVEECAHEHTGQRRQSDIPCAMALRLITSSPRRTALLPPLRPERLLPPGALTPAPRRQDHTPSPYASAPFVIGAS